MEKLKFIHAADLHLDSPFKGLRSLPLPIYEKIKESTFTAFHNMVDIAIKEKIDFLLLAGDLFDEENRSLKAQISLRKGFEKLSDENIHVYIIHGNHDHLGGSWANITWPTNVHIFSKNNEVKAFIKNNKTVAHLYGFSYESRAITENRVKDYIKKEGASFHIGLLHGYLEGGGEHNRYAPFTIQQLLEKNFDYWALGHIHKKEILHENPYIIYPGNIQGRHRKETGDKGCYLIELKSTETKQQFIPCASIIWSTTKVNVDSVPTVDALISHLQKLKEQYRKESDGTILTIELLGTCQFYEKLYDNQFMSELTEIINNGEELVSSFVWVDSFGTYLTPPYEREELKQQSHFISDLLYQIDDYSQQTFEEALAVLWNNRKANLFLLPINEDRQEIVEKAERLLLQELLKES